MHLIFTLLQTTAQKVRHIGSGCSLHKQWGLNTSNNNPVNINLPISVSEEIFTALPAFNYAYTLDDSNMAVYTAAISKSVIKLTYDWVGGDYGSMSKTAMFFVIGR